LNLKPNFILVEKLTFQQRGKGGSRRDTYRKFIRARRRRESVSSGERKALSCEKRKKKETPKKH